MKNPTQKQIQDANKILEAALIYDESFFLAWQANIAMAYKDAIHWYKRKHEKTRLSNSDLHRAANEAADNFLEMFTNVPIHKMKWFVKKSKRPRN